VISVPRWTHLGTNLDEKFAPKPGGAYAYIIECRTCGYEPDEQVVIPPWRCPKCSCFTWHRLPRPGMLCDKVLGGWHIQTAGNGVDGEAWK
jgi:hypothetical protein